MNTEIVCLPEDLNLKTLHHELRTPLVPILGLGTELLQTKLTAEQKKYVGHIVEAGHRLLQLANKVTKTQKMAMNSLLSDEELQQLINLLVEQLHAARNSTQQVV